MIPKDDPHGLLKDYVEPRDLAPVIGVSEGTLARWRSARKGPKPTKLMNRVVYHVNDVKAWIDQQRAGRS